MTLTDAAMYAPTATALAAGLLSLVLPWRLAARAGVLAAVVILASGIALASTAQDGPVRAARVLYADPLSAWMLVAVGAVAVLATASATTYLRTDTTAERRRYLSLIQAFLACMSLAILAGNLGLLWVAIEATTIVTAFLVGHRHTRASVEAAWKYVVLCSIGVAVAFLGVVCTYAASVAAGGHGIGALDWTHLTASAGALDAPVMRLATGLIVLGFGTKAGLAPMHAWLPDAHSQAPAPVSALMSGVLLSVAFYAILRYKVVVDVVLGPGYTRTLLLAAALASLAVAAALLIAQRDYKRLLAYSSIEHMGLIALGAAFGVRLAVAAALLHVLGHGLAKAVAFCTAGQILAVTGGADIAAVRGLAAGQPALAAVFGISLVALLGLPPFSLFASELGIARGGLATGHGWAVAVAFGLILIAFAAIVRHAIGMLLGPSPQPPPSAAVRFGTNGSLYLAAGLCAAAVLGITLGPLRHLLDAATAVVIGAGQ